MRRKYYATSDEFKTLLKVQGVYLVTRGDIIGRCLRPRLYAHTPAGLRRGPVSAAIRNAKFSFCHTERSEVSIPGA
ncbi:MAG: hypothetical protein ACHQHN_14640 [Sphingobacteriales bacterium]